MKNHIVRRPKIHITSYGINVVNLRTPWVIALWSLIYPGFGHLATGSYMKGSFLFLLELTINYQAHLNMAILYSFIGRFQAARGIINTQWILLYCAILVFAIWDSYRLAVEANKLAILSDWEYAPIVPTVIGSFGINSLEKRNPWVGLVWSLLLPGLAQLYYSETIKALFLLIVGIGIIILSHVLQAIHFTALGNFQQAKAVIDWQWLLSIPSFYGFAAWDAYTDIVIHNQLFAIEQAQYFKNHFKKACFKLPFPTQGG